MCEYQIITNKKVEKIKKIRGELKDLQKVPDEKE